MQHYALVADGAADDDVWAVVERAAAAAAADVRCDHRQNILATTTTTTSSSSSSEDLLTTPTQYHLLSFPYLIVPSPLHVSTSRNPLASTMSTARRSEAPTLDF